MRNSLVYTMVDGVKRPENDEESHELNYRRRPQIKLEIVSKTLLLLGLLGNKSYFMAVLQNSQTYAPRYP